MSTFKAVIALGEKNVGIADVPTPKVREEWVLVKVKALGLNPTDWKHVDFAYADAGSRVGCDYAGIVEEVGSKVTNFKKGDRITGFSHGGNRVDHETGAFGEFVLAKASVQIRIPDNVSFEQAATLGVAIATCGQGLYKSLGLPPPNAPSEKPFPLLIHGGSTAMGMMGIQYARASGLTVIATASPHNFDFLKSLGADAVFDYHSPTCGTDIKEYTQGKLQYAWDCAGGGEVLILEALSHTQPSKYGVINMPNEELLKNKSSLVDGPLITVAYNIFNELYIFAGNEMPPKADELEFATGFFELTAKLLESGTIKPLKFVANKTGDGLEGVIKGMDELRAGRVSGTKLVYTL